MENGEYIDFTSSDPICTMAANQFCGDSITQCAVYDQSPETDQYRITVIVRPTHTVAKLISQIGAQYQYTKFDLLLQPDKGDVVHLNKLTEELMYEVPGFEPFVRNSLVLLPNGQWHGDVKQRFNLDSGPQSSAISTQASSLTDKNSSPSATPTPPKAECINTDAIVSEHETKSAQISSSVTTQVETVSLSTKVKKTTSPTSPTASPEKTDTGVMAVKKIKKSATTRVTSSTTSSSSTISSSSSQVTKRSSSTSMSTKKSLTAAASIETMSTATTSGKDSSEQQQHSHTYGLRSTTGTSLISSKSSSTIMVQNSVSNSSMNSSSDTLSVTDSTSTIKSSTSNSITNMVSANNSLSNIMIGTSSTAASICAMDTSASKNSSTISSAMALKEKEITMVNDDVITSSEIVVSSSTKDAIVDCSPRVQEPLIDLHSEITSAVIGPPKMNSNSGILAVASDNVSSSNVRNMIPLATAVNSNSASGSSNLTSPPSTMTTVTEPIHTSGSNSLNLSPMSDQEQMFYDDLALGASASPTETEPMCGGGPLANNSPSSTSEKYEDGGADVCSAGSVGGTGGIINEELYKQFCAKTGYRNEYAGSTAAERKFALTALPAPAPTYTSTSTNTTVPVPPSNAYVGLVNQAMTCYLNSLLQALYMTPEFRNALYRWEFDNDTEAKNIPYQLQKLFLNLQTSKKSAVETTDLTRSFGWDSTEAWQQHDIQELCRVMFDALEHKFKNTKQANLISTLYEGQMIDYVKCLECQTEKTRSDTFLDIPLPVRPFGSTVSYGSIEEAIRAFVQPETLEGNNQYFCEKCDKKCDAHKGLKFKNFPYVLTLHLKRFDFDYSTMHRIKLNDKVTFPQTLNLNTFVNATDSQTFANLPSASMNDGIATAGANTNGNGLDDCSTTDSGSAMEEDNCSSGIVTTASSSQHENDMNDDDEGIDMSTSTADHHQTSNLSANMVQQRLKHESGPYIYELFAILIHSGSASGGHYYAYIKELENSEWFCFNDQTVSPITHEDIQRTFGGGVTKAYYSGVYSSSTNAYMLMYRQIDPKRNEHAMTTTNLPEHINTMLQRVQSEEETRAACGRLSSRIHNTADLALPELHKPRVFFYNPALKKLKVTRLYMQQTFHLSTALESAYQLLDVDRYAPLSNCRLVAYSQAGEEILYSYDDPEETLTGVTNSQAYPLLDFLLEYSADGQQLPKYYPGGFTWNVYMVNVSTMEMEGPFLVQSSSAENDDKLKMSIAMRLHINPDQALVATLRNKIAFISYDPAPTPAAQENLQQLAKAKFSSLVYVFLYVPSTDAKALQMLDIPLYEDQTPIISVSNAGACTDVVDAVRMNSNTEVQHRESPLPPQGVESNSEDSSLSDGDRTLVETLPPLRPGSVAYGAGGDSSQVSSSNHSPQLSSPEYEAAGNVAANEPPHNDYNIFYDRFSTSGRDTTADEVAAITLQRQQALFFYATSVDVADGVSLMNNVNNGHYHHRLGTSGNDDGPRIPANGYKLLIDNHMRMDTMKRHISNLIRVPCNYFQVKRKHDFSELQDPKNTANILLEGEQLYIDLGKILLKGEHKATVSTMRLSELNDECSRLSVACELIYTNAMTVLDTKRELISKLQRIDSTKYETLSLANCRLWLKGGRCPIKVFNDEDTMGHALRYSTGAEFLVQQCESGVKPQTSDDSLTLFVRRWHPDKLVLDGFQEITLEKDGEIRGALALICDIPEEQIAFTKSTVPFPSTGISLLSINNMHWMNMSTTLEKHPLSSTSSGNVFFYKDIRTAPRELSPLERRELSAKEKSRLSRISGGAGSGSSSMSLPSPRRERALKIYVDSSPESLPALS